MRHLSVLTSAVLLAAISSAAGGTAAAQRECWGNFERYAADNARVAALPLSERRVVFMGNSITDFWPGNHPSFFADNHFIGRGISGQSTYQFLSRFRDDVINLRPELVVLNAATNDCAENTHPYDPDRTMGNIISMCELARAAGIKVILTSTLPAAAFYWNPSITDAAGRISDLNRRIRVYAENNSIPYVDYYTAMVHGADRALNPDYTADGVHPNAQGYAVMEALILPAIQKALGE